MSRLTNAQLFETAQEKSATFENLTAKVTAEEFLNGGKIGGISESDLFTIKNEFFKTIITWSLVEIRGHRVKNPLEAGGIGVRRFEEYKGARQIMFAGAKKPVNPQFLGLQDGDSVDPFKVRKPELFDKFYVKNFNYSNWITLQPLLSKDAFDGPNGYGLYDAIAVILNDLQGKYTKEMYLAQKEVINYAINNNSQYDALKPSQIVEVEFADPENPTPAELRRLVNTIKNVKGAMTVEDNGAFNALGWEDVQEEDALRFITTPDLFNEIETELLADTYNEKYNKIDIKEVKLNNFGGLVPTQDGTLATQVYPVYDEDGTQVGYTTDAEGTTPYEGAVKYYNPNGDVIGIVCDYRFLDIDESSPYILRVAENARALYDNYFAHKIGDSICYRSDRNFVVIKKKQAV